MLITKSQPERRRINQQLRNNPTPAEKRLWQFLRNDQLGVRFRRQLSIGRYIVDFYAHASRLVIEVDGSIHDQATQAAYDAIRDDFMKNYGVQVLRISNNDVMNNIADVLSVIRGRVADSKSPLAQARGAGESHS